MTNSSLGAAKALEAAPEARLSGTLRAPSLIHSVSFPGAQAQLSGALRFQEGPPAWHGTTLRGGKKISLVLPQMMARLWVWHLGQPSGMLRSEDSPAGLADPIYQGQGIRDRLIVHICHPGTQPEAAMSFTALLPLL